MSRGLKVLFLIHATVSFIFGIQIYLIPGIWTGSVSWVPFDPVMTRLYGAALLGLAFSSWLGFRATNWGEVRMIIQMEIAFTASSALGGLYELLFASAPRVAWLIVLLYVAFGLVWFFFYRRARGRVEVEGGQAAGVVGEVSREERV